MIVECNFAGARFALHRADGTISYFVTRADAERAEAAAEASRPKAIKPQSLTQERYVRAWHEKRGLR